MINMIKNFVKDESGATAIEYGLIAALVAVAIIFALTALGDELSNIFQYVADSSAPLRLRNRRLLQSNASCWCAARKRRTLFLCPPLGAAPLPGVHDRGR